MIFTFLFLGFLRFGYILIAIHLINHLFIKDWSIILINSNLVNLLQFFV